MSIVLDGTSGITTNSGTVVSTTDATLNGLTVGKGGGSVSTNTAVGASALNANTTGGLSVAIGTSALAANTTSDANTAVGYQAASTQTTGALYTTAFGYQSLKANTSGTQNNGLGFQSLTANTTGANNSGFGTYALAGNTTGGSNTAFGNEALRSNTTASNNTAVGYQALYRNTVAGNTALGYSAGYQITTGTANTALGYYAMGSNGGGITGASNTAVGNVALTSVSTGSSNVAMGDQVLYNNTTGSGNVALGYQAGYGNTTDSNNIYIGYQCGSSVTGGGNVMFGASTFSGYSGSNQVACKVGNGREAFYADINAGASFRQYSNSSTWATTSDQRVKENIVEITDGLEKITALRPVTFDYITSKEHNAGFIAQDFQNVLPDQVKKVKARPEEAELVGEDEIYSIQQNLVPYMVNAIKELKALVDAQATEIAELKAKVA